MREPSEPEVLRGATKAGLSTVMTSLPGIVVSYNAATKTAVVEVAVHNGRPEPPLPDVPIKFPRGGGYRLVWPIAPGDEVTLIFYGLDPSRFRASGVQSLANILRRHGRYPVALPGSESELLTADYEPSTEGLHLGKDDGTVEVVVTESQIKLGSTSASDPVALKSLVESAFSDLLDGIISAAGSITPAGGGPAFVAALQAFQTTYEAALQVGADKVTAE